MWPGPRPTFVPSGTLIHPAVWAQQTWAENWGRALPLGVKLGPHLRQCGQGWDLTACQVSPWSVEPFGHNTPASQTGQTDRQTGQIDRQRSDSAGRTVLQNGRPKMAEPIDWPFGLWIWVNQRKHKFNRIRQVAPMCPYGRARWRQVANIIEPSVCGGDAVLCQITFSICYYYYYSQGRVFNG